LKHQYSATLVLLQVRYMDQMDEDLYFLRLGSNPVWKLMKLDILDFSGMAYRVKQASQHASSSTTVSQLVTPSVQASLGSPTVAASAGSSSRVTFNIHSPS
jgi:hypothetical protein